MNCTAGLDVVEDRVDIGVAEWEGSQFIQSEPGGTEGFVVWGGLGRHIDGRVGDENDAKAGTVRTGLVFDAKDAVKRDRDAGFFGSFAEGGLEEGFTWLNPAGGQVPGCGPCFRSWTRRKRSSFRTTVTAKHQVGIGERGMRKR